MLPNLADSDSDGEGIRVADDAGLVEVELLDVEALAVDAAEGAELRDGDWVVVV